MIQNFNALCDNIEKSINKLKIGNDFNDYDTLEFDILELNWLISDFEYEYENVKLNNGLEYSREFNKERENHKSDASTERAIDTLLIEKITTEKSQKIVKELYDRKLKWYIRMAEHIKGRFIKYMADEKRQSSVEKGSFNSKR